MANDGQAHAKAPETDLKNNKVSTLPLAAIVVSAMIGGGIFNLTKDMAGHAGILSQSIAWLITAVGMWILATSFRILAVERPELKDGIYTYARSGFGRLAGFVSAYGYWVYNTLSIVAYGTIVMTTLNTFFPGVFGNGNNWISVAVASALSWFMYLLCMRGVSENAILNLVGTFAKLIPIFAFLIVMLLCFKLPVFIANLQAESVRAGTSALDWSLIFSEASASLLITLFVFLGIEGAVVVSGNAKSQTDVSRATIIGFLLTLVLYVLVSLLPFGSFSQATLAQLTDPSMGAIMGMQVGFLGKALVDVGLIVSVVFAWLVWLLMLTQMPLYAARDGLFPKKFSQQNKHGAPKFALLMSVLIAQVFFLCTPFLQGEPWEKLISITGVMSMPCYFLCTAFLLKSASRKHAWHRVRYRRMFALFCGIFGTCFSVYLVFAGGLTYAMLSCVVYALGIPLLLYSVHKNEEQGLRVFTRGEWIAMVAIVIIGIIGILYSATSGFFSM